MNNIFVKFKRYVSILLCGLMLLGFTGCDNKTASDVQSEIVVSAAEASAEPSFPASCCGVKLEKAVEKAVSLSPAATEIICELGFKGTLVGISSYCDFPEGLSAKIVGSADNPEIDAIIALKPDAVFTLSQLSEREVYALNEANIAVLCAPTPTDMEGYSALYREIASAFRGREKAEGEKGELKAVSIGAKARSELEKAASSVELESFVYVNEKLTVAGSGTFENAALSLSGINLCKEPGYVSAEKLGGTAPKYIIASDDLNYEALSADATLSAFISSGAEIKYITSKYFERPSARTAKVFEQLRSESE